MPPAAALCRLGELRRLPRRDRRPPGRGSDHGLAWTVPSEADGARRLRRRAASSATGVVTPLHPPRRRLRRRDRGRRRAARGRLRRGRRRRHPPAAAVPALARARPHPGLRHRLGHRAARAGTTSTPTSRCRPATGCTGPAPTRAGRRAAPSATPPATAATTTPRPAATRREHGRDRRRLRGLPRPRRGARRLGRGTRRLRRRPPGRG